MRMHPTFTRVPQRSYDVFVGDGEPTLDSVLIALSVDPLEAEDARELFLPSELKKNIEDFSGRSQIAFVLTVETVSQWASLQDSAEDALESIVSYSHRLGVWFACQVARNSLQVLPRAEKAALSAITVAEWWVYGKTSQINCAEAADRPSLMHGRCLRLRCGHA